MNILSMTRTQRRADEMRLHLVEIAETLLIEGGMAAVTADEVARRADVSLQTVYNRIGRKPALLVAIAERSMAENRAYVDAAYDGRGTPEERGLRIFHAYVRFALERPHQFRILANPPDDPGAISRIGAMAREQIQHMTAIVRDGIAEEWVNPDIDPESAANAVWAMMNGVLTLALREDTLRTETVSRDSLIQSALTVIQFGLKRR